MIWSIKRRTRRSEVPVGKNACWSSRRWKRRRSGKRRMWGNEIAVIVALIVQVLLCSIVVTWSPRGEDHLSQRKKAGLVEAKERSRESWGWNCFEKVGVQHVDGVGDDGVVVSGGGDVGDSHNLPCNLPDRWNITSAPEKLPSTAFVLLMTRISLFSSSICKLDFSYFSSISSRAFSSFVLPLTQSLRRAQVSWLISDNSNYHITARVFDKVVYWVV